MNDLELLRAYVREGSEPAFAELARRYVNIVYSAALRHVHNAHDAEDVTQAVFLLLSRKARGLSAGVVVPAWLLRATHFASRSMLRGRARRKRHETSAATMTIPIHAAETAKLTAGPDWERVSPLLDEAVASLGDVSRDALVLRFFRNKSYKEVADRLAIAEPAARQRVSRAVDQLRAYFDRRGVVLSSAAFEALIVAHAVHAAPKGLAILAAGAGAKGATIAVRHVAIAKGAAFGMVSMAAKIAAAAIVTIVIGAGVIAVYRGGGDHSHTMLSSSNAAPVTGAADPTAPIRGRVLDPSGRPAPGAEVMLARVSSAVSVYAPSPANVLSLNTGPDGGFEFPGEADATAIVARNDEGIAQMQVSELRTRGQIKLTPWGRIEGSLKVGSKPVASQTVQLSRTGGSLAEWNSWRVMHDAQTKTDAQGHFVFPRVIPVPPGSSVELELKWQGAASAGMRSQTLYVAPRQTARVDIGGMGRPVIGQLAAPPGLPAFVGQLYAQAPASQPAGGKGAPQARAIPVAVQPEGRFRADDVPAGTYWLIFNSSEKIKGMPLSEVLGEASAPVIVPEMAGGRSDEPLDVGTIQARVNPLLLPGQDAPDFAFTTSDRSALHLRDLKSKYILLHVRVPGQDEQWVKSETLKTVYDRFGDNPGFMMLDVMLELPVAPGATTRPSEPLPWMTAVAQPPGVVGLAGGYNADGLPEVYLSSPTRLFLIGPDGKCVARSLNGRAALSMLADCFPRPISTNARIEVRVEHHLPADSTPNAIFKTIVRPDPDQNAARSARFAVVDGEISENSGGTAVLNDRQFASGGDQPSANFFFDNETLEGRLRMDLEQQTRIRQISTYSWHRSHRAPQVYKVYGSDGTARNFNAQPKIGVDPASCGWTKIAEVDTRPASGPDDGQYAVAVRGLSGPVGTYRHLLFVSFVTETDDDWGHTFFNEIEVLREEGNR